MKKITLISIICLAMAGSSFAQFKLGVRGGINFSNVKMSQEANEPIKFTYDKGMGFHFGLTSQLQVWKLYVQPELLFSTVTNEVTIDDINSGGIDEVTKQKFNKFDVPIIAGLKFGNFKVGAGPVGTLMLESKSDLLDEYEMQQSNFTFGYQLAAGFDFKKFNIEMRYEGNLSNLGSGVKIGNTVYDFDQRLSQLIITTAFYF